MIPILYEKTETEFTSNGICRLRDATSAIVTEERNGIYECDFDYPVDGANYDQIRLGRIIGAEHDDTNDVQPFDIVSYTKPINGIVSFHAVHISYRQSKIVTSRQRSIVGLNEAFDMLKSGQPSNPFTYWTDQYSSAEFPLGDGIPRSVRECLGGTEGSILDTYGGEYEWDKFTVKLWNNRGEDVDFVIRYGVNMTDYNDETDSTESYSAIVPYWVGQDGDVQIVVKGNMVTNGAVTTSGRVDCVAMDFSQEFESQPTEADLASAALNVLATKQPSLPSQTITVDFINLDQTGEYDHLRPLLRCKLCDRVRVVFPFYKLDSYFKIVKVTYDVLQERYTSMELGTLSTTLSEALGIGSGTSGGSSGGGGGGFVYELTKRGDIITLTGGGTSSSVTDSDTKYGLSINGHTVALVAGGSDSSVTVPDNFTTEYETKLNGIEAGAEVNVNADWNASSGDAQILNKPSIPTKTSELTNDSNFLNGNAGGLFYGTCSTAAGTQAKAVTCAEFTSADLVAGTFIVVTFTNTNTGATGGLTLNVNGTGAKPLKYINNGTLGNIPGTGYLKANVEYPFYYDGANWVVVMNYNTTYSAMSWSEMEAGTATTGRTITAARLKEAVEYHAPVKSVNGQTGTVTVNVPTKTSELTNDSGFITSAPVTSVNGQTGAVTIAVPDAISDLTNDMVYDLGTVSRGQFTLTEAQRTAVATMWAKGLCAVTLTNDNETFYAIKERTVTYNGLDFYGFVGSYAGLSATGTPQTGICIVGICTTQNIGIFGAVDDIDQDDVETIISSYLPTAVTVTQKTSSGTNIADITIGGTTTKLYAPTGGSGGITVLDCYPVGSYYETSDSSFDPNTAWGGTWVLEAEGSVHVSAGSTYTVGSSYGSNTHTHTTSGHTLTTNEIPAHTHGSKTVSYNFRVTQGTGGELVYAGTNSSIESNSNKTVPAASGSGTFSSRQVNLSASHTHDSVGGGNSHSHGDTGSANSWQPSIAVNRWHRTA